MIYAQFAHAMELLYANDCLAQCDGNTNVGPVNPLLTPGDSCSLSPPCELVISGDSIVCNFPTILSASPASTSLNLQNYQWYNQTIHHKFYQIIKIYLLWKLGYFVFLLKFSWLY